MYALIDYITFHVVWFLTGCTPIQQCLFYSVGQFATLWSGRVNDVAFICTDCFNSVKNVFLNVLWMFKMSRFCKDYGNI